MNLKIVLSILLASRLLAQATAAGEVFQAIPNLLEILPDSAQIDAPLNLSLLGCGEVFTADPLTSLICNCNGLTWGWYQHICRHHIDFVGCGGQPPVSPTTPSCNPYKGDTPCKYWKPILCINKQFVNRPPYPVTAGSQFYSGWTGGHLALTPLVQGCRLKSPEIADKYCRYHFGCGWQMAEHHDGYYTSTMNGPIGAGNSWSTPVWPTSKGGWRFWGMSNIRRICSANPIKTDRFWVKINDQPGNCWNTCGKPIILPYVDNVEVKANA